jgi:hypothetical protein
VGETPTRGLLFLRAKKNFWAVGKMMGVPAEVMKLVAALGHVEAIDGLAEVRRTPVDADDRQSVRF